MLLLRAQRICRWSWTPGPATGRSGVICLCDQRPCLAGQEKKEGNAAAPITLTFPPEEQRRMKERLQRRNQDHLHVLYASQVAL